MLRTDSDDIAQGWTQTHPHKLVRRLRGQSERYECCLEQDASHLGGEKWLESDVF